MRSATKAQEGHSYMKSAEKHLKTSMLKWSPDYMLAASDFEKAAVAFQNAEDLSFALSAYEKAAHASSKSGSCFKAATHMEKAAKLLLEEQRKKQKQMKSRPSPGHSASFSSRSAQETSREKSAAQEEQRLSHMREYFEKAAQYYLDSGEAERASDALFRAAQSLEQVDASSALSLYDRSLDLLDALGRDYVLLERARKIFQAQLRLGEVSLALALLTQRLQPLQEKLGQQSEVFKSFLSENILQLEAGDLVAADKSFMKHLNNTEYLKSRECAIAEDLITAFKNHSEEQLQQTLRKNQEITFLDNQVVKVARHLSVFGSKQKDSAVNANPSTIVKPPAQDKPQQLQQQRQEQQRQSYERANSGSTTSMKSQLFAKKATQKTQPEKEMEGDEHSERQKMGEQFSDSLAERAPGATPSSTAVGALVFDGSGDKQREIDLEQQERREVEKESEREDEVQNRELGDQVEPGQGEEVSVLTEEGEEDLMEANRRRAAELQLQAEQGVHDDVDEDEIDLR